MGSAKVSETVGVPWLEETRVTEHVREASCELILLAFSFGPKLKREDIEYILKI